MSRYYPRVAQRANYRCEYCRAPEIVFNMPFGVDHIIPRSHGGSSAYHNLALAYPVCNLFKSDLETGTDHAGSETEPLFNPRRDHWQDHFSVDTKTAEITGITAMARATVNWLRIYRSQQLIARLRWMRLELFP